MTHSQGSNSVAKHSALIGSHSRLFQGHSILSHQNTEKFQGMAARAFRARPLEQNRVSMRLPC
jgi:hypothetical protein